MKALLLKHCHETNLPDLLRHCYFPTLRVSLWMVLSLNKLQKHLKTELTMVFLLSLFWSLMMWKNFIWTTKAKALPFCPLHWPWLSLMLSVATFTASEHFICPDLSCQSSLSSLDPSLYYKTDKHAKSLSYDKIKIRVLFNKPHVNNCSKQ